MKRVNFDANACYGLVEEVQGVFNISADAAPCFNPSSIHAGGQAARACIEEARADLMSAINLNPGEYRCIFTAGATESNNFAIAYATGSQAEQVLSSRHYISTAVEHPSVLKPLEHRNQLGDQVTLINPERDGSFSVERFLEALRADTRLVSVMLANNETGQILPVPEIFAAIKSRRPDIFLHTDAVQAFGKLQVDFAKLNADAISVSGHKIGALSGVGAVFVREALPTWSLIRGGAQELSWRSGTENVLGIHTLGVAARALAASIDTRLIAMREVRAKVAAELKTMVPQIRIISDQFNSLENTICAILPAGIGGDIVVSADLEGVLISSGSACSSGKPLASHVLLAMGYSKEEASRALRISFRHDYEPDDITYGVEALRRVFEKYLSADIKINGLSGENSLAN